MARTKDAIYRICDDCGEKWKVSRLAPGGKTYICPHCELKRTQEAKKKKSPRRRK